MAFEQVETTPMRQFREAAVGRWTGRRARLGTYWCAADRPTTNDTTSGLMVRPVYLGSKVPADAECAVCHIGIRELQEALRS